MVEYAMDFDVDGDKVLLCDTPDGTIGVWNHGSGSWQSAGLSVPEVDALVSAGEFRWQFRTLRDVLGLNVRGPFCDEEASAG